MADQTIDILRFPTIPDVSGEVFIEPYSIKATNAVWGSNVAIFNDSGTRIGLRGRFRVPKDYIGSAKIVVNWTATATSGDIEWDFDYRAVGGDDSESMDQAGTQETVNVNDTAPTAIHNLLKASLTLTSGNFAIGDEVEFELFRDGTDGGDTMAAAAIVFSVSFDYADV